MSRQEFEQHYNNGAVKVHAMPAFGHVDVDGHAANTIAHYGQRNHIPSSIKPPAEQTPGQDATGGEAAAPAGGGSAMNQLVNFQQRGGMGQPGEQPQGVVKPPTVPDLTARKNPVLGTGGITSQKALLLMLRKAMGIRTRRTRQYANR